MKSTRLYHILAGLGLFLASVTSMVPMVKKEEGPDLNRAQEIPSLALLCIKCLLKKELTEKERVALEHIYNAGFSDPQAKRKLEKSYANRLAHEHAILLENMHDNKGRSLLQPLCNKLWKEKREKQENAERKRWRKLWRLVPREYCEGAGYAEGRNAFGACPDGQWLAAKEEYYEHPGWGMPEVKYVYLRNVLAGIKDRVTDMPLIAHSNNPKGFMVFYDDAQKQAYMVRNNNLTSLVPLDKKLSCVPWQTWAGGFAYKTNSAWVSDDDKYIVINMIDLSLREIVKDNRFCDHYGKRLGIFDSATGKCLNELKADDHIFASLYSKNSSLIAAFTNQKIFIWDPYTGEKKGEFEHPFHSKFIFFGDYLSGIAEANRKNNFWKLWCNFLNNNELFAVSWCTDCFNNGTGKHTGLYIYNIASGKLLSKTKGWNTGVDYPVCMAVKKYLSFDELKALITLEKQYTEKKKLDEDAWRMLYWSKLKPLQDLTRSRYLFEEDAERDKFKNLVTGKADDSIYADQQSDEQAHEYAHEDSLCSIQ